MQKEKLPFEFISSLHAIEHVLSYNVWLLCILAWIHFNTFTNCFLKYSSVKLVLLIFFCSVPFIIMENVIKDYAFVHLEYHHWYWNFNWKTNQFCFHFNTNDLMNIYKCFSELFKYSNVLKYWCYFIKNIFSSKSNVIWR